MQANQPRTVCERAAMIPLSVLMSLQGDPRTPVALGLTKGKIVDVMPAEVCKVLAHQGLPCLETESLPATM